MKRRILAGAIFGLVAVFFIVSYFGITTSGEDVYQGANTEPAVLEDMGAAFQHNARIPDMYAWAVINFFDYQYSFGLDTIFRLVDVAMGIGISYLMTYLVLGRKLRLELKDAVIFGLGFLMIFLSPHGRVLYAGFSAIHNYLLIVLISLVYAMPFLRKVRGAESERRWWFDLVMLIAGVVFGLSSNLAPIAFLLTFATILVVKMVQTRELKKVLKNVKMWEWLGIVGIVIGMGVAYIGGPGVSGYFASGYGTEYDYVGVGEMIREPARSVKRMARHVVNNSARVLGPAVVMLAIVAIARVVRWKVRGAKKKLEWGLKGKMGEVVEILTVFVMWHVLIATQLNAPLRILLTAYVAGIMAVLVLVNEWTKGWKLGMVGVLVAVMVAGVVTVRTMLAIEYHEKAGRVLERVRESEAETICVTREEVTSRTLPMVYLGQEDMVADWAMPEKIYGKEIVWCK